MRQLCLKVGKKDKFPSMLDTTEAIRMERRIVISNGKLNSHIDGEVESAPQLRSLVRQGMWHLDKLQVELRLLRVSANVSNMLLEDTG